MVWVNPRRLTSLHTGVTKLPSVFTTDLCVTATSQNEKNKKRKRCEKDQGRSKFCKFTIPFRSNANAIMVQSVIKERHEVIYQSRSLQKPPFAKGKVPNCSQCKKKKVTFVYVFPIKPTSFPRNYHLHLPPAMQAS